MCASISCIYPFKSLSRLPKFGAHHPGLRACFIAILLLQSSHNFHNFFFFRELSSWLFSSSPQSQLLQSSRFSCLSSTSCKWAILILNIGRSKKWSFPASREIGWAAGVVLGKAMPPHIFSMKNWRYFKNILHIIRSLMFWNLLFYARKSLSWIQFLNLLYET